MKIKNYQVKPLFELLISIDNLRAKKARMRSKLIKILMEHHNGYITHELNKLKFEHAIKDEEGNVIFVNDEKTEYQVHNDFLKDENELLNEYFFIEMNQTNEDMLLTVADILLEGEFDIQGSSVYYYDEWCEESERIIRHYENKATEE